VTNRTRRSAPREEGRPGAHAGDQLSLFADIESHAAGVPDSPPALTRHDAATDPDAEARRFATDPANNVVLEASAGTGKTSVLVARYINLLKAGVDPAHILAITFTRKAAAEMRERIVGELRDAAARSPLDRALWQTLRDRLGEIAISTIDAFCLSLLREFPLEADLDPAFGMADETEVPRLIDDALDRALRIVVGRAKTDADIALVLAQLGITRTREGLATLLERRLVAWGALDRFLATGPSDLSAAVACRRAAASMHDVLRAAPGGLAAFVGDGPVSHPRFQLFTRELERLARPENETDAALRGVLDRVSAHFLTLDGKPRKSGALPPYRADDYPSPDAARRHRTAVFQIAPQVDRVIFAFKRDLNVVLARGVRRLFAIALEQYRRALDERSVLDFADVLQRALRLLEQMDEFAQSRFRLESRYHHVLVDEFQDTSRAQWQLVSLLVKSWGEGLGLPSSPSIFIVGDRKQSIYRFRDAEVSVMREAATQIEALRPSESARRSISRSFRAVPQLLQFVNDVFGEVASEPAARPDDFTYAESDRFPIDPGAELHGPPALGIVAAEDPAACAASVAIEIARILREDSVRDKRTGVPRGATPGDIAILFRSRTSHREFEHELQRLGIPTYVYKGLGFFDADETKDVTALIRYLANPSSNLRAAAFLRSRFVRISDRALAALAPDLAASLAPETALPESLAEEDRRTIALARTHAAAWLSQVDRVPPAELIEQVLRDSAYAYELGETGAQQAWENLKKMRGLVRRIQNRGYATLTRIADHLDALTAGDESNAVIEALDAVNLMTVHAAKGLEFPIVFVVNMAKGASGFPKPVRVVAGGDAEPSVSVGPFVSEMDDLERVREKHETRRLLYVALTRARDRLYLSSALKGGAIAAGRGSLAEVLPASICALFARAATVFPECDTIGWTSSAGNTFDLKICRPPDPAAPEQQRDPAPARGGEDEAARVLITHIVPQRPDLAGPDTHTVTAPLDGMAAEETRDLMAARFGALVHKLIAASRQLDRAPTEEARLLLARAVLIRERLDATDDRIASALRAWNRLRSSRRLEEVLAAGERYHELPFSFRENGVIIRGTIDCLIRRDRHDLLLLEFKIGAPQPEHQIQLDTYVRAARSMFPDCTVEGRLVYL
jgi:ATP-dependent helicase/nuclease subunit A